jgi:hypothetical protein
MHSFSRLAVDLRDDLREAPKRLALDLSEDPKYQKLATAGDEEDVSDCELGDLSAGAMVEAVGLEHPRARKRVQ